MEKRDSFADITVLFFIMVIGAAEAAHLCGVFFHRSVSECTALFAVFAVLCAAALGVFTVCRFLRTGGKENAGKGKRRFSMGEGVLLALFVFLVLSQILYMEIGKNAYVQGDMTVETVESFLTTDAFYQVDPLTGRAYEEGLPTRIEILCIPTLYAALSSLLHIRPDILILYVVPVITLLCCYSAYSCLAEALFPEDRGRRLCFLVMTALLVWIGSYGYGMDGFGLLFSGWRGVTIRNGVLIPYAISLCLRGKYRYLPLCILAEACILWTLYGLGFCLPVISGMLFIRFLKRKRGAGKGMAGKEAADGGAP
ncbi:MAG: DUF6077 domain-containing protein [Firmicutes bacterium]|nr:DUF6077 domain-containing protein [Bacillota bacterium]